MKWAGICFYWWKRILGISFWITVHFSCKLWWNSVYKVWPVSTSSFIEVADCSSPKCLLCSLLGGWFFSTLSFVPRTIRVRITLPLEYPVTDNNSIVWGHDSQQVLLKCTWILKWPPNCWKLGQVSPTPKQPVLQSVWLPDIHMRPYWYQGISTACTSWDWSCCCTRFAHITGIFPQTL